MSAKVNTRPGELFQVQIQNGVLPEGMWWTSFEGDEYSDAEHKVEWLEERGFITRIISNQRGQLA